MSILQEYESHTKYIGRHKLKAVFKYAEEYNLDYSDIVYDRRTWDKFDKWYKTVYNLKYGNRVGGDKAV